MTGKNMLEYYRYQYHCQYLDREPCISHGYFKDLHILIYMLNKWNRSSGWKYWLSESDKYNNLTAERIPVPLFKVGHYGTDVNSRVFNNGDLYETTY